MAVEQQLLDLETENLKDPAELIDISAYPLHDSENPRRRELVAESKAALREEGSFTLTGFLRPEALARAVTQVQAPMETASFHHFQQHNIYFAKNNLQDIPEELREKNITTSNHTLTCDQLSGGVIHQVYCWDPLKDFLAEVLERPALHRMEDPLAALNVMGYGPGEQIGWHFDRANFTVTIPLQAPEGGGLFRYVRNLRSASDPNHDGVARLLAGDETETRTLRVSPGSLNVFAGFRSAHRVTPIEGKRFRMVAVLSYMPEPGVVFSPEDREQFYGRSTPQPSLMG